MFHFCSWYFGQKNKEWKGEFELRLPLKDVSITAHITKPGADGRFMLKGFYFEAIKIGVDINNKRVPRWIDWVISRSLELAILTGKDHIIEELQTRFTNDVNEILQNLDIPEQF